MSEEGVRRILSKYIPPLSPTQVDAIISEYVPLLREFEENMRKAHSTKKARRE